ncbi:High-osmolarity-induced transcription protein 1 [Madurella mycetomatis]|uniref:High-osmolarity-induced transcription protein 1 n=1 Tax=Madurella mycetomatis TaxID=100816 RepID=A0A175VU21_9PEZI|nr:High-osmolarity-induced transcription protein 1 [Madurella mycetomatis]
MATIPVQPESVWEGGQEPPKYRICRAVWTVEGLWREWTVGLRGQPAVTALDSKWGNWWRAGRQSEQ